MTTCYNRFQDNNKVALVKAKAATREITQYHCHMNDTNLFPELYSQNTSREDGENYHDQYKPHAHETTMQMDHHPPFQMSITAHEWKPMRQTITTKRNRAIFRKKINRYTITRNADNIQQKTKQKSYKCQCPPKQTSLLKQILKMQTTQQMKEDVPNGADINRYQWKHH